MKKHLIAAAVAGAFAVPAMAQVSISGRIDTSIQNFDAGPSSSTRVNQSLLTSNQLVFSGNEDLGGGLRASFLIASNLISDSNNAFDIGSRGIAVTLSGAFGAFEIGKTPGTAFNNLLASGVTGNIGNLFTVEGRPNNMIGYTSPTFSGLSLRLVHGVGNETPGPTKGNGRQTEVSAIFASGPVTVRVAQADFKNFALGAVTGGGVTGAVALPAAAAGGVKQTGADLAVRQGPFTINARYTQVKLNTAEREAQRGTSQYGIGASYAIGGGLTAALDYMDVDNKAANADLTRTSVTLVQSLSKRTNVYGAYYSDDFQESGRSNASVLAFGVRHSF